MKASIQSQNDKIARQDEEIMSLRSDISKLDDKVAVLTNALDAVCNKADNNEQYSRRYCLQINGIPTEKYEKASDCVKKVTEVCRNLQVDISQTDIDRAHHVGRVKSQMIVKFHSFKIRS